MYRSIVPLICWLVAATALFVLARVSVDVPIGPGSTISLWTVRGGDVVFALDTPRSILLHVLIPLRMLWAMTLVPVGLAMVVAMWRARRYQ